MNSAFIQPEFQIRTQTTGTLCGLRFAVKDLIDVKGFTTGGGNPDWLATHTPSKQHAPCVQKLLQAGALCVGKTITDELAYSLEGRNYFYGTPLNPKWPKAMPGGSSSGSASAVAQGLVDFSLGTDTGGSVRVPAAFCGIWGIRPTYQSDALEGVLPFATCFDTVGWFAQDVDVLERVTQVLIPTSNASLSWHDTQIMGVEEAFVFRNQHDSKQAFKLEDIAFKLGMQLIQPIFNKYPKEQWLACYQYLQDYNIYQNLGSWLEKNHPKFGPQITPHFQRVLQLNRQYLAKYQSIQREISQYLDKILNNHLLILPTTPMALLPLNISQTQLSVFYQHALTINAIAGLAGLPQLNIPVKNTQDYPIALSLIGPKHSELSLINQAKMLITNLSISE